MGRVQYDENLAPLPQAKIPMSKGTNDGSVMGAAFRQENPVVAAFNLITRPQFEPDDSYDFSVKMKENPTLQRYSRDLARANSNEEFDYLVQQIMEEEKDRAILMSAGAAGIGSAILAGLLTPTILLPGGQLKAGASIAKTAASTAAWAAIGVSLDEALLQADQEIRPTSDTVVGIGSAFVLGGLLGGGFQYLSKGAQARIEADMAGEPGTTTVSPDHHPSPVPDDGIGAQRSTTPDDEFQSAGGIFGGRLERAQSFISPVTRTLNQTYSDAARWMQAQLTTAGVYLEGNTSGRVGAVGGELQELVKQHYGKFYRVKEAEREQISSFLTDFGESSWRFKFGIGTDFNEKDWNERVGRAIMNPQAESVPQIRETALSYRNEVYLPMLKEAQQAGLLGDMDIEEAMTYFPRNVKPGMATSEWNDLQQILTEHIEETLTNRFSRGLQKLQEQLAERQEELDLINTQDPAAARAGLEKDMATLPQQFSADIADLVNEIRDLRALARVSDRDLAKQLREQARQIEKDNKDALKGFRGAERKLRRKFRALDQSRAGFERAQRQTMDRINAVEEQQINTTLRASNAIQKVIDKMAKLSDTALDAEIAKIQERIEKAFGVWARGEERLEKLKDVPEGFEELVFSDIRPTEKISLLEDRQKIREAGMAELEERLAALQDLDRDALRQELTALKESLAKASNVVNNKRALRLQKLRERADALKPEKQAEIAKALTDKIKERRYNFLQRAMESGLELNAKDPAIRQALREGFLNEGDIKFADDINFRAKAEADADDITNTLAGNDHSFSISTLIEKRGPEIARTLNIDPDRVWSNGRSYGEFVEVDAEKVARRYVRTMGADIELMKRFRTVNPLLGDSRIRAQIRQDFNDQRKAVKGAKDEAKQLEQISKTEEQVFRDLNAQVERLRHTRGIPENPNGFLHRAGRVALNLNTVRLMGGVVLASIPDLARPIFTYGLLNTFRDGFLPLVNDLKTFKRLGQEMRYAGTGLDLALHGRSAAMFDIFDELEHGTMFERGLQWTTNNFGRIALFDQWNTAMKMLNANIANAYLMSSMEKLVKGTASKREIAFLAKSGIDSTSAAKIWEKVTNGGADNVNGTWIPNTETWVTTNSKGIRDTFARDVYRAALAKNIDDNILTPNLERPLFADGNMFGRLVFQFRSFTFSSVQKIQIAAMQDLRLGHTAPIVAGSIISLALGAMSYYTWAAGRGGQSWEDAKNADLAKVADEAISRSGLLGVLSEVQRMADTVPGVPSLTLSGKTLETSPFRGATQNIAGPTYGLIESAIGPNSILMTAHDPNSNTIKKVRQLMPYNNIPVLSQGFTMAERGAANLLGVQ